MASVETADWLHLTDDEEVLWNGHPSLYTIGSDVLFSLFLIVVGIGLTAAFLIPLDWVPEALAEQWAFLPLILVAAGIVFFAIQYGMVRRTHYVITTEEVYRKEGLISQDVLKIRHDRIQNTTCSQSALERLFSFGDITIYTAGSDDLEILLTNVSQPQQVSKILTEAFDNASSEETIDPPPL
jgi:uncharacterized membrane protein YdbT with pleckstrin-like domain